MLSVDAIDGKLETKHEVGTMYNNNGNNFERFTLRCRPQDIRASGAWRTGTSTGGWLIRDEQSTVIAAWPQQYFNGPGEYAGVSGMTALDTRLETLEIYWFQFGGGINLHNQEHGGVVAIVVARKLTPTGFWVPRNVPRK